MNSLWQNLQTIDCGGGGSTGVEFDLELEFENRFRSMASGAFAEVLDPLDENQSLAEELDDELLDDFPPDDDLSFERLLLLPPPPSPAIRQNNTPTTTTMPIVKPTIQPVSFSARSMSYSS